MAPSTPPTDRSRHQILALAEPLFTSMAPRVSEADMALMRDALDVAIEAHTGQKRKNGEPYIIHPIAVARIVGEQLELGAHPVCAAFLHDVVEDTPWTIEQVRERFGPDVAFLVNVVTKKKKNAYDVSKQVDNFRQMLNSIDYDIRALLIKLADRLHNMRTLASMPPDKQMKIAGETDFFYAPLANRLGLYRVKIELENLSFRYRCPRDYAHLKDLLEADRRECRPALESFMDTIRTRLAAEGIDALVEADFREPFSIRRKMQKRGCDFRHVEHRHFVRIVYPDNFGSRSEKENALKIYSIITDLFQEKPGSVLNYIDAPKENGYQSLHVKLLNTDGQWQEVHISSRRMRRLSRLGCVALREESNIARWIERFKKQLHDIAAHNHEMNFMEGVTASFYNDDIMVFTPQGKPVTLPQKATALDFAFEVHTHVGLHAQYARINGQVCSVTTPLHRGDCVEIGTRPGFQPHPEWLDHVVTYKARRQLIKHLRALPASPMRRCPHCHPIPGDEVVGFRENPELTVVHKRDCPVMIADASQQGDSVVAVEFTPDHTLYPVTLHIRAVDRYHLLGDLIDCITNRLRLSIKSLTTDTLDEIVDCTINFGVHSYTELSTVIDTLTSLPGVDEVSHTEA